MNKPRKPKTERKFEAQTDSKGRPMLSFWISRANSK